MPVEFSSVVAALKGVSATTTSILLLDFRDRFSAFPTTPSLANGCTSPSLLPPRFSCATAFNFSASLFTIFFDLMLSLDSTTAALATTAFPLCERKVRPVGAIATNFDAVMPKNLGKEITAPIL
jgi:hypothetical protein